MEDEYDCIMSDQHFISNGNYFGYPKCCINSFVYPIKKYGYIILWSDRSELQKKVSKNGFIPCKKHAKMILEGKLKIEDLILPTRKHEKPFPKE